MDKSTPRIKEESSSIHSDVQVLLAGLLGSGMEPTDIIRKYLQAVESGGMIPFHDPLYPHVELFRRGDVVHGYIIKDRTSMDEATREVDALRHWARQNAITLGPPHYLSLISVGQFVLSPYVGPEVYMVEHQLSGQINNFAYNNNKDTTESLAIFRRAMVLRQVDMLSRAVVDPYIPHDEAGHVIVSNKDIIGGYKQNMRDVLRSISPWSSEREKDDPIDQALDAVTDFFIGSYRERYVDTYSRNICFRAKKTEPEALLRVTLDDILQARISDHQERTSTDPFTMDMLFLQPRLVQVDLHRNEKEELRGECLANIVEAPRLLACDAKGYEFGQEERINAVARFELGLEIEREAAKGSGRRRDYLEMLYKEIEKTNEGKYSLENLAQSGILTIESGCPAHYHAMSLYKAIRWIGYVTKNYIPQYEHAVSENTKNPVAKERLKLYKQDKGIYIATALQSLHALMDELYQQLPKGVEDVSEDAVTQKEIVLNHTRVEEHRTPYKVRKEDGRYYFFNGKTTKSIITDSGFKKHINVLDQRAASDPEKAYAKLLKLGYIEFILAKA
ncbi:hypothetical protein HZA99_01295 [Candidatus Woesearchaeota archaeon]|nr:hypothetical protein [Candidatus Woesearchaeota archaeon]